MKILHPLINEKSAGHYDDGKIATIEEQEARMSVIEMIGACKYNIHKYSSRKEKKGTPDDDLYKIKTFKNYLEVLIKFKRDGMSGFLVCDAIKQSRLDFAYRVSDLSEPNSLF